MRDALAKSGRPIAYSICEWGQNKPWTWAAPVGNLWRTTGDISDKWSSMIGKAQANRGLAQYAGPGHWNDPDMLEVGNGGMTAAEYRTHFSLWAMMAAPLLIGSDLRKVSDDSFTILKNSDVIALDQDPLGKQATVLRADAGLVVYSKVLANGDRAVALSNETAATATISTSASATGIGSASSYTLKDLWSKATRTTTGSISASVPAHATVLYRLSSGASRYEAESASLSAGGTVDANHAGFSGTGFANGANAAGSYVEWQVTGPASALTFGYANGTAAARPVDIAVDGTVVATGVPFPPTGAWTTWSTVSRSLALTTGRHTVRVTATTADGPANLDYLDVSP
jgi:alpha-galactosidase